MRWRFELGVWFEIILNEVNERLELEATPDLLNIVSSSLSGDLATLPFDQQELHDSR